MPHIPNFLIIPAVCAFIIALSLSLCSFFVVMKRWSFLSVGVSHAAFGGVAAGYLLRVSPEITSMFSGLIAAFLIASSKRRGGFHEDVTIGVIFSFFMGLGVLMFSKTDAYITDAFSYLFGNILSVEIVDLFLVLIVFAITVFFVFIFRKKLFLMILDQEMAYAFGVPVETLYYLLVFIVTLNVIVAIKLAGVILVPALTIVPASCAFAFSSRFSVILIWSLLVSLFIVFSGLTLSIIFDIPPGATMAVVSGIVFFFSLVFKNYKGGVP